MENKKIAEVVKNARVNLKRQPKEGDPKNKQIVGLTVRELATRVGCTVQYIYQIESGRLQPGKRTGALLEKALELNPGAITSFHKGVDIALTPEEALASKASFIQSRKSNLKQAQARVKKIREQIEKLQKQLKQAEQEEKTCDQGVREALQTIQELAAKMLTAYAEDPSQK